MWIKKSEYYYLINNAQKYYNKGYKAASIDMRKLEKRIKELEEQFLEERQKRLVLAGIMKEKK